MNHTPDTPVIAFIGGGNMAASLIGGWLAAGHASADVHVAEPLAQRRDDLRKTFGIHCHDTAAAAVVDADAVVLAVKPQQMAAALDGLTLRPGTVVVSIAAGINTASLRRWLGPAPDIVRCMPNTPALVGAGITGLYTSPATNAEARTLATRLLSAAGDCVWIDDEALIDAVTALSGSGPAYYFLLTEALCEAGIKLGLPADVAAQLARQTFTGSAKMVVSGDTEDVIELRRRVTSKGGTTEAAIAQLESGGLRELLTQALTAAADRGRELGIQLSEDN